MKWFYCFLCLGLALCLVIALQNWKVREVVLMEIADFKSPPKSVKTIKEIDAKMAVLEQKAFSKLDEGYLDYSKSLDKKYLSLLKGKSYFVLDRDDLFKTIVNDIRIKDLLSKDKYYKACLFDKNNSYYWLMDKKLLHKILLLQEALEKKGHNPNGFKVVNGHRHPLYNEKVGGASKSRHIKGEAIDIHIKDIDGNGYYEAKDKQIVLDLLEKEIIKSEGGIGKYPGTRAVHFDVRGYRARWDSY